ncbi:branched-chain amino acid transporter AzlC [Anaerocolumna cellulosilytica]|uniref:Branched-chain amino acid transporter AzlC n=1 Tax=Anaerocolumna cellulosilytica TaxID=433286 RepID=A0A6S6R551_9FIRM|nr:AzlC family ABC transporter permease [Anaerocolumna cellulosilytica]MBB5194206.1 4-azaleucine resistance transporter AzlC [Anaerocolumna cellulosilytica]BCJ94582.1 branched-chain amino acid transporter AzlC [Anaerocolumna cellulosilytica]
MNKRTSALKAAFPLTIPVMTGYLVLGAAFGILMNSKGYSYFWTIFASLFIYAGSMQFVAVSLLTMGFHPFYACMMTLMVNARHLFYGVSMLSKFKGTGSYKPYLIFGLTDETFSVLCVAEPAEGVDKGKFMFFITLLNQIYWIVGSVLGCLLGSLIDFNTRGIDFVLTALFVVIFVNQWKAAKSHTPVLIGVGTSIVCRILFGAGKFIVPSMAVILLFVSFLQKKIDREVAK